MRDVITRSSLTSTTTEVKAWISNYIPIFHIDAIIYTYPNPDVGLAKAVSKRGPGTQW